MKIIPLNAYSIPYNKSDSVLWRRCVAVLSIVLLALWPLEANGGTVAFQAVATPDNVYTELVSVTVEGRPAVAVTDLIGIDVFHFFASSAPSGSTSTNVLGPNTADPPPINSRAALLDNDNWLNTGVINIASGTGIVQGESPTSSMPGIGVNFLTPIINGSGDEIVLFDHGPTLSGSGDSFIVTFLGEGIGYGADSMGTTTIPSAQSPYSGSQQVRSAKAYKQDNPVSGLEDHLELKDLIPPTSPTSFPNVRAVSFDLSLVGVPLGGNVTGLFIQSISTTSLVDPVFIAGLPVPEPSTTTMILSGLIALASVRRRIKRT